MSETGTTLVAEIAKSVVESLPSPAPDEEPASRARRAEVALDVGVAA